MLQITAKPKNFAVLSNMKGTAKMRVLRPEETIYYKTFGKLFRITAIFNTVDAANEYMLRNPGQSVIATFDNYIFDRTQKRRG